MPQPATDALLEDGPTAPDPAMADAHLDVTVHATLEAAEAAWRELETRAVLTPYQRFDWIAAWHRAGGTKGQLAILIIELGGRPAALLPLEIRKRFGIATAIIIGSDIGNSDWMIVDPDAVAALTRERLLGGLRLAAGAVGGIDLVALHNLPRRWGGFANPLLAFRHRPGPDHLYLGALRPNGRFDSFDDKRLGSVRRRTRKVAETLGPVSLRRAATVEEVDTIHRAFLEQRGARFQKMGIANIFAEPQFLRLFREAAVAGLGQAHPALVMHALYAGDTIVGSAIGLYSKGHYSQYINATAGGDIAKHRLIGLLAFEVFNDVAASGITTIDFGVGDFDYKKDWAEPETVYDGMAPLTLRGTLAGRAMLLVRRVKRAVKQHDLLWKLFRKVRAALAAVRTRAPGRPDQH